MIYKIISSSLVLGSFLITGCGSDSDSDSNEIQSAAPVELTANSRASGAINEVGDVDWYSVKVEQAGLIAVNVYKQNAGENVELLLTVYEKSSDGKLTRLAADHSAVGEDQSSNVSAKLVLDSPKTLHLAVRDLNDDASDNNTYLISYDVAKMEDGNDSFETATFMVPGDQSACQQGSIDRVGDADYATFTVPSKTEFEISTRYTKTVQGSPVSLDLNLYNSEGVLIGRSEQLIDDEIKITQTLPEGNYYVAVQDKGNNDFDNGVAFKTCVQSG